MNFQFKTLSHNGTIKPVKSNTGKHAGKWVCRIKGPKVTADGIGTKTIYSAPFIGAAKAAIAKYLRITVSEIEADSVAQGGGGGTPQPPEIRSKHTLSEFDDNEEEFANFDLNAAVSSAVKQLSSSQNSVTSSLKSPLNPYNQQPQKSTPNNLNLTAYKKDIADPVSVGNSSSWKEHGEKKPPKYPKQKSTLKLSTDRPSALATSVQSEQVKLNGMVRETERLRLKREHLLKEVTQAKKQREELEKANNTIRAENKRLGGESEVAKKEKAKLKGGNHALHKEHERAKSDLEKAKQQKEKLEKEARAVHEEKEGYEKEVKSVKKSLNSRKAELDNLTKQLSVKAKSSGETATVSLTEPPKKKRKAGKSVKSGVVTQSMKVADLQAEGVARGINVKTMSGINKTDLLGLLVVGSTCITKTDVWGEVLRLREKFEKDRREAEEQETMRQHELNLKHEQEEKERKKKLNAEREKKRALELSSQVEKHTYHFPTVHPCKLAKTNNLLFHGESRCYRMRCEECVAGYWGDGSYTCEKCNFDICQRCFKEKTMTPKEKKAEAKRKAALEKERLEAEAERRRLMEEEEKARQKKWDPRTQFKPNIIKPAKKNLDPDGNETKGFTVWSSDGYENDGWHSCDPSLKHFDSTYATNEEANERARYLFYWKNPWGNGPERIMEQEEVDKSMRNGLVTYVVAPPDSSTWTVSVVPDAAYAYLENATHRRHGHGHGYPTAWF